MAAGTYYGINYDYQFVDVPPVQVEANMQGKRISMIDTVEVATASGLDAGTVLTFFKPPQGARLVGGELLAEAGATGMTLAVGTGATKFARKAVSTTVPFESADYSDATAVAADGDKFLTATAHSSAAKTSLLPIALIDVYGYEFDGSTVVTVTSATAAMVTGARVTLRIDLILP